MGNMILMNCCMNFCDKETNGTNGIFWGQYHACRKGEETNYNFVSSWKDPLTNQDWDRCQVTSEVRHFKCHR